MLSDEEKKAIDSLKVISEYAGDNYLAKEHRRKLKMLIELVEKQSKEIEHQKEKIKTFKIEDENIYLQFGEITEKKRWQDKIKTIIEEVQKDLENSKDAIEANIILGKKLILQSLLDKEE